MCVSSMCVLNVYPQCVSSMCILNVNSQCVSLMCVLNVCPKCVSSMCILNVYPQCISSMFDLNVVGPYIWAFSMFVLNACPQYAYRISNEPEFKVKCTLYNVQTQYMFSCPSCTPLMRPWSILLLLYFLIFLVRVNKYVVYSNMKCWKMLPCSQLNELNPKL